MFGKNKDKSDKARHVSIEMVNPKGVPGTHKVTFKGTPSEINAQLKGYKAIGYKGAKIKVLGSGKTYHGKFPE